MATQKSSKTDDVMTGPASQTGLNGADEYGFVELDINIPAFNPEMFLSKKPGEQIERYEGPSVQGVVLAHRQLGVMSDEDTGEERPAYAYLVLLDKATKCKDNGVAVDVPAGKVINVWPNAQLKQALPINVANHPHQKLRIRLTPIERGPAPNDSKRRMWKFKVEVSPKPVDASTLGNAAIGVIAMLQASAEAATKALPTAPF